MKTIIFSLLYFSVNLFAQSFIPDNIVGVHYKFDSQKGMIITTNPVIYDANYKAPYPKAQKYNIDSANSTLRYIHSETYAIGNNCTEAGNGLESIVGWMTNYEKVSAYGNSNGTALWEYQENPQYNNSNNYVVITPNGNYLINGFHFGINLFNGTNGGLIWSYSLASYTDTVNAGPVAITSTGNFIIATVNAYWQVDTSYIFGFNNSSNIPVWTIRIPPQTSGSTLFGIRIAASNDSLAIVNWYSGFYVIRTYTGQIIYTGTIGTPTQGTNFPQGISGDGTKIATIDYFGYVKLYQWNGSTYNLLWSNQEPPGTYYNYMTAVDISNDGTKLVAGTLNIITSSTFDGKIKFYNTSNSTPAWVYSGCGDEVSNVKFSKNGRFLSAASFGSESVPTTPNLFVFKTTHLVNIPWYEQNSTGSFFDCSISDDGTTVIGSGKAVNAREFGYGGMLYNLYIDTAENPTGIHNNQNNIPASFGLSQNYPNPFNPSTIIAYDISVQSDVKLVVYDILGREITTLVSGKQNAGTYHVIFNANDIPSGVYFYKLTAGSFVDTKKMTLVK